MIVGLSAADAVPQRAVQQGLHAREAEGGGEESRPALADALRDVLPILNRPVTEILRFGVDLDHGAVAVAVLSRAHPDREPPAWATGLVSDLAGADVRDLVGYPP